MDLVTLTAAFTRINNDLQLPDYLQKICEVISSKSYTRKKLDHLLSAYSVNQSVAKVEFLHLILAYIGIALEDHILTEDEIQNIRFLKTLFQIQPGDFYYHNKYKVEKIMLDQLSLIYEDDAVSKNEENLKIGIQEIFDLSFDQMNEYAKSKAAISIQHGADPKDLDVFFSYDEYFKLKSKQATY